MRGNAVANGHASWFFGGVTATHLTTPPGILYWVDNSHIMFKKFTGDLVASRVLYKDPMVYIRIHKQSLRILDMAKNYCFS